MKGRLVQKREQQRAALELLHRIGGQVAILQQTRVRVNGGGRDVQQLAAAVKFDALQVAHDVCVHWIRRVPGGPALRNNATRLQLQLDQLPAYVRCPRSAGARTDVGARIFECQRCQYNGVTVVSLPLLSH